MPSDVRYSSEGFRKLDLFRLLVLTILPFLSHVQIGTEYAVHGVVQWRVHSVCLCTFLVQSMEFIRVYHGLLADWVAANWQKFDLKSLEGKPKKTLRLRESLQKQLPVCSCSGVQVQTEFFRPSATVSRIGLMESRLRRLVVGMEEPPVAFSR